MLSVILLRLVLLVGGGVGVAGVGELDEAKAGVVVSEHVGQVVSDDESHVTRECGLDFCDEVVVFGVVDRVERIANHFSELVVFSGHGHLFMTSFLRFWVWVWCVVRIALGRLWWVGLSRGCPLSFGGGGRWLVVCTYSLGVYV